MDPNELLRLIRLTIAQMNADENHDIWVAHAVEVTEYFEQLDEWLSKDGFLPTDWMADEDKPTEVTC
jgi:hypothetical protein